MSIRYMYGGQQYHVWLVRGLLVVRNQHAEEKTAAVWDVGSDGKSEDAKKQWSEKSQLSDPVLA